MRLVLPSTYLFVQVLLAKGNVFTDPNVRTSGKHNVLFIVADDMRPELGSYKVKYFPSPISPRMFTPNLDRLARQGLVALNAHVQYGMCGPSRTSFLTSRRPDTTHVYDNLHYFREVGGNFTTLPQYFKEKGYVSVGMGKIFHPGLESSGFDDPPSWSEPYWHAPNENYWWLNKSTVWEAVPEAVSKAKPLPDEQIKNHAIETLARLAPKGRTGEQPFFLAVGFLKPHLPFVFPEKYLDFYPKERIRLPDNDYAPVDMPPIAWSDYYELRQYRDLAHYRISGAINSTLPAEVILDLRRAYYSALTYTDAQIGHVIEELDRLGLRENTIISFIGDHGWQLGEHGEWCKHTNFELSTHAPLIVSVPGMAEKGSYTEHLIEFVDIFPTLAELAGFPSFPSCPHPSTQVELCTEGASFAELFHVHQDASLRKDRNLKTKLRVSSKSNTLGEIGSGHGLKNRALSQFERVSGGKPVMGYSLRSPRYRYTEWVGFRGKPDYKPMWEKRYGIELYDHETDPRENINVVNDEAYEHIRQQLSQELHDGYFTPDLTRD